MCILWRWRRLLQLAMASSRAARLEVRADSSVFTFKQTSALSSPIGAAEAAFEMRKKPAIRLA